jgi:hypothetical protein
MVLAGTALVAGGTGAYFAISGLDKKQRADRCLAGCRDLIDDGRRAYVIADVALGVAVAAATAAVLVWVLQPSHSPPKDGTSSSAALLIEPSLRAAQLSWNGRF